MFRQRTNETKGRTIYKELIKASFLLIPLMFDGVMAGEKLGYECTENEPWCVENYNKNLHTSHGRKRVVVAPINFSDTDWNPSAASMRGPLNRVNNFYQTTSRGKYGFSEIDIRSVEQVDLRRSCGNRSLANNHVGNTQSYDLRIFSFPDKTCSFGGNAGGKTVNMNSGNMGNTMTLRHEIGHIMRLTHSRDYERGNCRNEKGFCPDKTTFMGAQNTQTYNAPELHWLGWFEKHEVERILPGKLEYQLRAIDNNSVTGETPLALVYDMPHTGNRMFIAMPKRADRLKEGEDRLKSHELAVYIASPCMRCTFQKSMLVERFTGSLQDETGLSIEVVETHDLANVTLYVSHSRHAERCTQPPEFSLKKTLQRALGKGKAGKVKLTVEAKNHKPPGCRPLLIQDGTLQSLWNESGERELSKRIDGVDIDAVDKTGANYIFTESDSLESPRNKPRASWEFTLVSEREQKVTAKIKIGNFAVIEAPVGFTEE